MTAADLDALSDAAAGVGAALFISVALVWIRLAQPGTIPWLRIVRTGEAAVYALIAVAFAVLALR